MNNLRVVKGYNSVKISGAQYGGIDAFRLVAAGMVIAIHTAPFSSVLPFLDVVFTYGLFRLAVPFFFLCSGFFAGQKDIGPRTLWGQTRKLAGLYLFATLLYLPLVLYAGPVGLWDFLYKLFWEGSFYHLWYFPAAILGLWAAGLARRFLPHWLGCLLMALLYCAGLLGDNYFAVIQGVPFLYSFSQGLLAVFGFTRNGLFFAAPFLYAGMALSCGPHKGKPSPLAMFMVGSGCLAVEAIFLWDATGEIPQGSMYISLPLAAVALFCLLLKHQPKVAAWVRPLSMYIFIVHPWCIAVLYALAGKLGFADIMQNHSGLFFIAVALVSFVVSYIIEICLQLFRTAKTMPRRATAQINLAALRHNCHVLQKELPTGCEIMAVVKADAYGHGAVKVARALRGCGVRRFAVATFEEGIHLRLHGIGGEILVLGRIPGPLALPAFGLRLTATIVDEAHAKELADTSVPLRVQLKIDTGMHRLGLPPDSAVVAQLLKNGPLRVTGVYSHLATADSRLPSGTAFANHQAGTFFSLMEDLYTEGLDPGLVHLQSSYGFLNHPGFAEKCGCVRLGLALYGATAGDTELHLDLRPVLTLTATVVRTQALTKGTYAGYSFSYQCPHDAILATVSLGYADGLPRNAVGAKLLVGNEHAEIVAMCMDTCLVDITHIPSARAGDTVTFIGPQAPATELAKAVGSIPNEIISRIGPRVKRLYNKSREE